MATGKNIFFDEFSNIEPGQIINIPSDTSVTIDPRPPIKFTGKARQLVKRLEKISYEQPVWNEAKVTKHLQQHYDLLGVEMPKIKVADNAVVGFGIARDAAGGAARDAARGAAWGAARGAAWGAARDAAWDAAGDAAWDAARGAAGDAAGGAARDAARGAAWGAADAIAALHVKPDDPKVVKYVEIQIELLKALENGLGFYFPMKDNLVLVPMPRMIINDGRLHYDHGKAVEWKDGIGFYFLHGVKFEEELYNQIIEEKITLNNLGRIENADQRAVAVQMLRPDRLLKQVKAKLIHTGMKGTKLYEVKNFMDTGSTEHCMLMTHPSLPDKQFIEWVEPKVAELKNADVAQCYAWQDKDGQPIPLEDYLLAVEA